MQSVATQLFKTWIALPTDQITSQWLSFEENQFHRPLAE